MCHSIGKNGCASVLKTILWEDGKITKEEKEGDDFVWVKFNSKVPRVYDLSSYEGKRFIVLSDENRRIVRWMNWLNNSRYCPYFSFNLSDEQLVDELLWGYSYLALNHAFRVDSHCLP